MPKRTDSEEKALLKSLRQDVIVQHNDISNDLVTEANAVLRELGTEIRSGDSVLRQAKYLGSAAVHIYETENLGMQLFVSQVETLGKTPEAIASAAFSNLQNQMMMKFGRKERRGL